MEKIVNQQRGAVTVLFVLLLPCLFGIAALVVDMGLAYVDKIKLQNTVDAAALAGVQELPVSVDLALYSAVRCARENGLAASSLKLEVTDRRLGLAAFATRESPSIFGKYFGMGDYTLAVRAKAKIAPLSSAIGVLPLGVFYQDIQFDKKYALKIIPVTGEDKLPGIKRQHEIRIIPLAIGGRTYNVFEDNLRSGYQGKLAISDKVAVQADFAGDTVVQAINQRITADEKKPLLLPVIDKAPGRADEVQIIGFTWFRPKTMWNADNYIIEGEFKQLVSAGKINDSARNFGAYASALVE